MMAGVVFLASSFLNKRQLMRGSMYTTLNIMLVDMCVAFSVHMRIRFDRIDFRLIYARFIGT